jgi:HK97 family phage major capsid protein
MSFNELKNAFEDYRTTVEVLMTTNEERLKQLERKGSEDGVTVEKIGKLENTLSGMEAKFGKIQTAMARSTKGEIMTDGKSQHQTAFNDYIQKGLDHPLAGIEKKSLSVGSDPDGGYLVPDQMYKNIISQMKGDSTIRALANVVNVSSDRLDILVDQDEFGSGWIAEIGARDETDTAKLAKIRIAVHEHYAEPRITQKLLDDSSVNVEQWLAQKITERMAKMEEKSFISGNGEGCPRGFLTYDAGNNWGQIAQRNTGSAGSFRAEDAADVLIETVYDLKSGFLSNANWVMNRSTLAAVRSLKDNDGHYVWQPSLIAGEPSTLLGYPVALSDEMPSIAEDSLSIAFGDFKNAYTIVDRQGINVLRDPFTSKPYVKFYTTKRVGADVTNFDAIKLIKFGE